jgi:hypothetical protein
MTQAECSEKYPDDPSITDGGELLRRIPEWHWFYDSNLKQMRPSSAAFEDDQDGDPMSVYRRNVIEAEGDDVRRVLAGHRRFALAALTAGQFRSRSQTVFADPLPEEASHAKVCGPKTRSVRRWFAANAIWVVPP